ncbi:MAG: glycosyltransferase family 39 protein [Paracoccus sp. (in: a-proteobacteria)]|nr:glycosyltransferase family 39 protein [Paracoccus sp. (in: a-proteobacteria)]
MAKSNALPRPADRWLYAATGGIAALTLWRVMMLWIGRIELSTDEAQYWLWSQHPSWGEYSKPPLIGWVIAASTGLLGDSVAAVRLPAPLIHGATALVLLMLGRRVGGPALGALAALSYLTMPAVTVGSVLMTTDTPMLLCLALALLAQHRLAQGGSAPWAILLGLSVGAGLLAKHAMLYGVAGMALAAALSPGWRIGRRDLAIAAAVTLIAVSPHLWWLAESRFVTMQHMAESGASRGVGVNIPAALRFLAEQFAVMGPLLFAAFWIALIQADAPDWVLRGAAVVALTILGIVTAQALFSHALANWAVGFTVPGCLVATGWMRDRPRFSAVSLLLGLVIALALPLATRIGTGWMAADRLALGRYLGHDAFGAAVADEAARAGATAVISGDRDVLAALSWYLRDSRLPVHAAPHPGAVRHHWDLKAPLPDPAPERLLLVTRNAAPPACAVPLHEFPAGPGFLQGSVIRLSLADPGCVRP